MVRVLTPLLKPNQAEKLRPALQAHYRVWLPYIAEIREHERLGRSQVEVPRLSVSLLLPEDEHIWNEMNADGYQANPTHVAHFKEAVFIVFDQFVATHDFFSEPTLFLEEIGNQTMSPRLIKIDRISAFGFPRRWMYCDVYRHVQLTSAFVSPRTGMTYRVVSHLWQQPSVFRTTHGPLLGIDSQCFPSGHVVYEVSVCSDHQQIIELEQERSASLLKAANKVSRRCANSRCSGIGCELLKKCAGCGKAYYCTRTCQKADWPNHRRQCHK